jgi:hypothetical protein
MLGVASRLIRRGLSDIFVSCERQDKARPAACPLAGIGIMRFHLGSDGRSSMKTELFQLVATRSARFAGVVLLAAAAGLSAWLAWQFVALVIDAQARAALTSASLIFALILFALCAICWQAGYRLARNRPGPSGSLFSRPAWFAIGGGLVVITALMGGAIVSVRRPTLLDCQVVLTLGGFGVWCLVLAFRGR